MALNLVLIGMQLGIAGFANAETKVGGFVDAQTNVQLSSNASASALVFLPQARAFSVADSALYFNYDADNLMLSVDLPFTISATGAPTFGQKDQWFVTHQAAPVFAWRIGKFDRMVGFESNDSQFRSFLTLGRIHSASQSGATPAFKPTHLGVQGILTVDTFSLTLLGANDRVNATGLANPEFGLKFAVVKPQGFRGSLALLLQGAPGVATVSTLDLIAGHSFGPLSLDFELIAEAGGGLGAPPINFAGWTGFSLSDAVDINLRIEYLQSLAGAVGSNATTYSLGGAWKLAKLTSIKGEITTTNNYGAATGGETALLVGVIQRL